MDHTKRWGIHLDWVEWETPYKGTGKEFFFDREDLVLPKSMPDKLLITEEFLAKAVGCPWFAQDGSLIVLMGSNGMICYKLIEQSPMQLSWYAEKVKDEIQTD